MATKMTARVPTTPEVQAQLRELVDQHENVNTYDGLLREELLNRRGE